MSDDGNIGSILILLTLIVGLSFIGGMIVGSALS